MTGQSAPNGRTGRDRGDLIGQGGLWLAKWSLILVSVSAGAWVVGWLIAALWVVVLPVLLAIIVATVLWPPTRSIMRVGLPPAASAATAAGSTHERASASAACMSANSNPPRRPRSATQRR